MPQMMPMYWTIMTLGVILVLYITTNFLYFMYTPSQKLSSLKPLKTSAWNWTW